MDTVAGVWFPRGGMRAVRPGAGRRRAGRRRGDPLPDARRPGWSERAAGCARCATAARTGSPVRRGRADPGPAAGAPAARPRAAAAGAAALVALRGRAARRVHRELPRAGAPHDLFGDGVAPHVPRDDPRGSADDRPVAAGHPADRRPTRRWPRRTGSSTFVLAPCPNTADGPIDWRRVGAGRTATSWSTSGGPRRWPVGLAVEVEPAGHPGRLGGDRPCRRHAVLRGAHVRPDRAVPAAQPGAPGWRTWCWRAAARHPG